MRLEELFQPILSEAPGDLTASDRRTMLISPAEIYQMTGQTPPQVEGPNGRMVQPPGWYDKVEMPIGGKGGIDPQFATAHRKWSEGGKVPGLIYDDETGKLKPYNENYFLEDLSWQIAAGAVETASAVTKGGAKVIDDALALVSSNVDLGDNILLKKTMATSKIVDGKREYDEFFLDDWQKWLEGKTDQAFRDNVDATAGAVESFGDIGDLFMGGIPGGWEGALGIMASELPSEILDLGLMVAGGPYGLTVSGVLNALEAGGAAASEIQKRIDRAYDEGILQTTPNYQVVFNAAQQQLLNDENFNGSDEELNARAANMAREQLTHSAINRAFYAVAATGGVLDTIQNKVLYGGPIKPNFLKNAFAKAIVAPGTEAISEMGEQWVQNLGIMSAAGKITTQGEGVINAGWNGWIAGHTATVVGTTADAMGAVGGDKLVRGAKARLRQFFFGGSKDVQALIDIMGMDPNTLITNATDSEGKLNLHNMVKDRLVTSDMLTGRANRRGEFTIRMKDGSLRKVTKKQAKENDKNIELLRLMSSVDIDPKENVAVVMFKNDDEIRRVAQLLNIDSKGDINKVMAQLEEVRKIDVRIEGKSKLEAPVWSELNERQQQEYIQTGKIKFVGDPERGTQTWTRQQIMFNSRRNNDTVPEEIANLLDNTSARPDINSEEYAEMKRGRDIAQEQIDIANEGAERNLKQLQTAWDNRNPDADPNNPDNPRPTKANLEAKGEYYIGTQQIIIATAQAQIKRVDNQIKADQQTWDSEFADTHTTDGVVIVSKPKPKEKNQKFNAVRPDALDLQGTSSKKYKAPVVVTTDADDSLSRAHIVANAKIAIANGDMDPAAVNAMIESLETTYPGINTQILPDGIDSYKQNPNAQVTKIQDETKSNVVPDNVPRNGKPPKGSIAVIDGTQYEFLGAMWAATRPDGTRGTTNHKNHKKLNKIWQDSLIDTTGPDNLVQPNINDDGKVVVDQPTKPNVDTTIGSTAQANINQIDTKTSTSGVDVKPSDDKTVTTVTPTLSDPSVRKDVDPPSVGDFREPKATDKDTTDKVTVGKPPPAPKFGTTSQTIDIQPGDFREPNIVKTEPKLDKPTTSVRKDVDPEIDTKSEPPKVVTTGPGKPTVTTKGTTSNVELQPTKDKTVTKTTGPNLATPSTRIDVDPNVDTTTPKKTDTTKTDTKAKTDTKTDTKTKTDTTTTSKSQKQAQTKLDTKPVKSKITSKDQQQTKKPRLGFAGGSDQKKKPRPLPSASPLKFGDPLDLGKYQTFGQGTLYGN